MRRFIVLAGAEDWDMGEEVLEMEEHLVINLLQQTNDA